MDDTRGRVPGHSLTADGARRASLEELRRHLTSAPNAYLEGAVQNPELTADEMTLLLRNRFASPSLLTRVGQNRQWTRYYEVKRGLVRHPRTPYPVARNLVMHLYWRDLAESIEDARLHPALRRQAEQILEERLPQMSLGEQISLARRASGALLAVLRGSGESRVLRAVLGNPRLKERDAEAVASGEEAPGEVLGWLTRHPKWGNRRAVRLALVRNARTPVADALKLVAKLPRRELEQLVAEEETPKIVRVGAMRRLEPEE